MIEYNKINVLNSSEDSRLKTLAEQNNNIIKSSIKDIQHIVDFNELYVYEKKAYIDLMDIINNLQTQVNKNKLFIENGKNR